MNRIVVDSENLKRLDIEKISQVLLNGGVVALPTDTVYGLVCRADYTDTIKRIYQIKGREENKPLPVFVDGIEQVSGIVDEVSVKAKQLMQNLWPGALTLIFPCHNPLYQEVTRNTGKVGLRMPLSKLVLQLLEELRVPLASTSANISAQKSAVSAEEVEQVLGGKIDLLVDGGKTGSGVASTVVDVSVTPIKILRIGEVSLEQINKVLEGSLENSS